MPHSEPAPPVSTAARLVAALVLPALLFGCGPRTGGSRPPDTPIAAPPAPPGGAAPEPTPASSSTWTPPAPGSTPAPIDFATQLRPILETRCSPCHFPGGRMYEAMPFDREETIRAAGTEMLPRLRDPLDAEALRIFLQQAKENRRDGGGDP